jgi:hypothetical protein
MASSSELAREDYQKDASPSRPQPSRCSAYRNAKCRENRTRRHLKAETVAGTLTSDRVSVRIMPADARSLATRLRSAASDRISAGIYIHGSGRDRRRFKRREAIFPRKRWMRRRPSAGPGSMWQTRGSFARRSPTQKCANGGIGHSSMGSPMIFISVDANCSAEAVGMNAWGIPGPTIAQNRSSPALPGRNP